MTKCKMFDDLFDFRSGIQSQYRLGHTQIGSAVDFSRSLHIGTSRMRPPFLWASSEVLRTRHSSALGKWYRLALVAGKLPSEDVFICRDINDCEDLTEGPTPCL